MRSTFTHNITVIICSIHTYNWKSDTTDGIIACTTTAVTMYLSSCGLHVFISILFQLKIQEEQMRLKSASSGDIKTHDFHTVVKSLPILQPRNLKYNVSNPSFHRQSLRVFPQAHFPWSKMRRCYPISSLWYFFRPVLVNQISTSHV